MTSVLIVCIVHFIFVLEMVQTCFTAADGFHWFVFGFGDMDRLGEFFLANFDSPMMSAVIAFVVQLVYAWRVFHLSKLRAITGIICVVRTTFSLLVESLKALYIFLVCRGSSGWRTRNWYRGGYSERSRFNYDIFTLF